MSDLQIALAAGGGVLILAVIVYNVWQERRARRGAERAFGERPPDVLFDHGAERREPTLGAMPDLPREEVPPAHAPPPPRITPQELEAPAGPAAEISSRVDTVAVILADDPVMREQLDPLLATLGASPSAIRVEGIVDEQWHPVDLSPRQSWRELRLGLQLASRRGAASEEEIERFNHAVAEFADAVNAVSQREAPAAAAARARDLDRFAADADIEVAVNVIGHLGATFAITRVKQLALEYGMSETVYGELVSYASDGSVEFVLRRFDEPQAKAAATYYTGLTFALDLPNVGDPATALADMTGTAATFAEKLGGQLVDDNRRPLSEAGLASIRRSLEKIVADMEAHGIPAGSPLARRLFS